MKLISSVRKKLAGIERPVENRSMPPRVGAIPGAPAVIAGERVPRDIAPRAQLAPTQASRPNPQNMGNRVKGENPFANLPTLRETPIGDRIELYRKKLQACSIVYDFSNPEMNAKEKEAKRQTLLELVDYENNTRNCFTQEIMKDVVNMVSSNIFRALPPSSVPMSMTLEPEEEDPTLESSWPHLQFVYEYFLRFVASNDVDPKIAKRFVDSDFITKLLDLFNSEDPRERDYLKTILHRIYGRFMALRSFIRKSIQYMFFKFLYEDETFNGVTELLEILGSIINGFALPLKEEHKHFLQKCLIPLHCSRTLISFHQQLSYCMTQYVEKDPKMAVWIIEGILRYWPRTNTPKEVIFLNELEEILEVTQAPEFEIIMEPLFHRLAACTISPHFQVAERVLFLWNNEILVKFVNQYRRNIFPIMIGALYKNSKHHWNQTVHGLTFNVLRILMEADPPLFDECFTHFKREDENSVQKEEERDRQWKQLISGCE